MGASHGGTDGRLPAANSLLFRLPRDRSFPPMLNDGISVPYNHDLKALEDLLSSVRRAGDFFVHGAVETPVPRLEVEGVGVISFPVPETQVKAIIRQASRAPYGRGEETLLDESVRRTWQLPADRVRPGGGAWDRTFARILESVVTGLGCADAGVSAELYKLLVYEPGGFFATHRDTEKAGGMFGTLVIMLPSVFRGGELVIRHAGREVVADLSSEEFSELKFAAFYADCEHEVRPVAEGHRVCLVYNLIQTPTGSPDQPLSAPLHAAEIDAAGRMLLDAFVTEDAPAKLAWLLEHQYSPAGLSFAGLKGEDAARAKVLRAAAAGADCAVHLGIVHIEEHGPAEPCYHDYRRRGRGRWRRYDDEEEIGEDAGSDSFEVIEVTDASRHIDQWVNEQDQSVAYGRLPLAEGEVLPAGALDDEEPDEQRLTEATGNEGASFERAYHRAALVIWPRGQFAGVLLQAGVAAALPYLAGRVDANDPAAPGVARKIIETWERFAAGTGLHHPGRVPDRAEMLRLLGQLGDRGLLKRFITGVVTYEYDGGENKALANALLQLGPKAAGRLLAAVVREYFPLLHCAGVDLADGVRRQLGDALDAAWSEALHEASMSMVRALPAIEPSVNPNAGPDWRRAQKAKPVDAGMVTGLLGFLRAIGANSLRTDAAAAMVANVAAFDPGTVLAPALRSLQEQDPEGVVADPAAGRLWVHSAEFLLARSETPPPPPTDWRQAVTITCRCEDCRALQEFVHDPETRVARFRMHQGRRYHVESQIRSQNLDLGCETDTRGRPQTLICTKNRRTFQRQCQQHRTDCLSMTALLEVMRPLPNALIPLARRLAVASERRPQP